MYLHYKYNHTNENVWNTFTIRRAKKGLTDLFVI